MIKRETTKLDTPCREYQGSRHPSGYGRKKRRKSDPSQEHLVHRWIWEQVNGPIPKGMCVLHRCDNPPCFRYDHLFLGTKGQNNADRAAKGRTVAPRLFGEDNFHSKLTNETARQIRERYATGGISQRAVAAEFGVSQPTVHYVVNDQRWKDGSCSSAQ